MKFQISERMLAGDVGTGMTRALSGCRVGISSLPQLAPLYVFLTINWRKGSMRCVMVMALNDNELTTLHLALTCGILDYLPSMILHSISDLKEL